MLREVNAADPRFRYLALSRNFGKESAMLAGLSQARGAAVAIMDGDLQHPPQLLAHDGARCSTRATTRWWRAVPARTTRSSARSSPGSTTG